MSSDFAISKQHPVEIFPVEVAAPYFLSRNWNDLGKIKFFGLFFFSKTAPPILRSMIKLKEDGVEIFTE